MTERDFVTHYGSRLSSEEDVIEAEHFHTLLSQTLAHFYAEVKFQDVEGLALPKSNHTLLDFTNWLERKVNE